MDIETKTKYDLIIHLTQEEVWTLLNELEEDENKAVETVDMRKNQYRLHNEIYRELICLE